MWILGILAVAVALVAARFYVKGKSNTYHPDMKGKTALVTGGTAGIGKETVKELAKLGCRVIFTGRDEKGVTEYVKKSVAQSGRTDVPQVDFLQCDMGDLDNVKKLADKVKGMTSSLDLLVNNAGFTVLNYTKSKQGYESTQAVNFIAPFYLTHLLFPLLKRSKESRIINVSSRAAYRGAIHLQTTDKDGVVLPHDCLLEGLDPLKYGQFGAYGKSKLN